MNKPLLLTQQEALVIRDALCAMNVIGSPMLKTAIYRPASTIVGRDEPETIVFEWGMNEAGACEITIFTSSRSNYGVRMTYSTGDKIEHHDDQNRFFKAYGVND